MKTQIIFGVTVIGLLTVILFIQHLTTPKVNNVQNIGQAPSGLASTFSTSSLITTASTKVRAIATSTNCASRVVGTKSKGVLLDFGIPVLTDINGFWQAASTTVVYDGGQYGCGAVEVLSDGASTIFVGETF